MLRALLLPAVCTLAAADTARALDVERSVRIDDSASVAGRQLMLNGAGVARRLVFRVYAIGLYLIDRKDTAAEVLATEGPRRITIAVLRGISGTEFQRAVADHVHRLGLQHEREMVRDQMAVLVSAISRQPDGLREGDTLTLDWVPGTGTVVQLNGKALVAPMPGQAFYNALLSIWLGDDPAEPSLKPKLLGRRWS
jgi:hypothetical protein